MQIDTSKRGFASMDQEKRKRIASMGGKKSKGNFAHNHQRAAEAGRKGGLNSHKNRPANQNTPQTQPETTSEPNQPIENI